MWNKIQKIYIGTNQVRPELEPWTPWANTFAYFPLKNDATDVIHNIALTSEWTTNYTTVWGVKSAEFTKSNWLYDNNFSYIPQWDYSKTLSCWLYVKWGNISWGGIVAVWWDTVWSVFWIGAYSWSYSIIMTRNGSTSTAYTPTLNTWINVIATYNNSDWKMYINGNWYTTWGNTTAPTSWNNLYLWQNIWASILVNNQTFYWNMSEVILEDKERTPQEVANYYNQTKSTYWL